MKPVQLLLADVPWRFGDVLPGNTRGASNNYPTLSVAEACAYKSQLPPLADDCLLFFWRVSAMPSAALDVIAAWGFEPKSEIIWEKKTASGKDHFGMGRYVRASHEACIIATRGRATKLIINHGVRSRFSGVVREHSRKPDEFFQLLDVLCGRDIERFELFAREPRPGWHCSGRPIGRAIEL